MKHVKFSINCNGKTIIGNGTSFDNEDLKELSRLYFGWKQLNKIQEKFKVRRINIPESVSEGMVCALTNTIRTNGEQIKGLNSSSCDAININDGVTLQIKACSTTINNPSGSPSSFGPRSEYDKLIYAHFDCDKDELKLYELNENLDNIVVNKSKGETFKDQCEQGRRPRFNLLPIVKKMSPFITYQIKQEE